MLVISWVVYAAFFGLYMLGTTDYEVLPQLIGLGLILLMLAFLPHWYVWMSHRHAKKQNDGVPPETVIHRITGDGAKRNLIAPLWSADKKRVLNDLNKILHE